MKIRAKCVSCKHQWDMTQEQLNEAQALGCATCPKCYGIAFITQAGTK